MTYRTMLNRNGESRHPCFNISPLSMMLSVGVFADVLYQPEKLIFLVFVLGEGVEFCPMRFL